MPIRIGRSEKKVGLRTEISKLAITETYVDMVSIKRFVEPIMCIQRRRGISQLVKEWSLSPVFADLAILW